MLRGGAIDGRPTPEGDSGGWRGYQAGSNRARAHSPSFRHGPFDVATVKRNLRTGRSLWLARPLRRPPFEPLDRDAKAEILIVGAGVSGALIAESLTDAGFGVMIVDRRNGPLLGSTPASTALVQHEIDTPLIRLARRIGFADAARAWRRSKLAVDSLAARTRELKIDCGAERRDALYLAGDRLGAGDLAKEASAHRRAGLEARYFDRAALKAAFNIDRPAALLGHDDLAVDPRRLAAGYLKAAIARGATLRAPCEVVDVETSRAGVVARTARGPVVRCKHLIYATGYETPRAVPKRGHRILSTFALATKPQPRRLWPRRCFIWEASEPYLYMRTTGDGRVICGGEDEEVADADARDAMLPRKIEAIRRKLGRLLPELDTHPDFAWCGTFGSSADGLPSIGAVPGRRNCWAALGYGGNGVTYSRIAADILRGELTGESDPDADLFRFRA